MNIGINCLFTLGLGLAIIGLIMFEVLRTLTGRYLLELTMASKEGLDKVAETIVKRKKLLGFFRVDINGITGQYKIVQEALSDHKAARSIYGFKHGGLSTIIVCSIISVLSIYVILSGIFNSPFIESRVFTGSIWLLIALCGFRFFMIRKKIDNVNSQVIDILNEVLKRHS